MLKKIIDRPILATVISLIIVLLGIIGITKLPITRFPEIAPPSVSVSAGYSGADAETVAKAVLLPLEESINGVEDMTYIRSSASSGSGTVNVYFKQGIDPNQAATNVQTRVSKALTDLPAEVVSDGVTVTPRQTGTIMTFRLFSDDPVFDETFLQAYANNQLIRELLRIDGVAQISRIGARNYAVRIWLDPDKMRAYGLVPDDIKKAVKDQNFEIAPGKFGESSEETFETVIKYGGQFTSQDEFRNIIVKTTDDGAILYLRDVARVALEATNTFSEEKVDGKPGVTMNLTQNSGANAREIDIAIREKLEELSASFPRGIKYDISYSVRDQIDESINQVVFTIIEAFLLVFLIVYLFLQSPRATIIPAIAIPVSLIGAFFFIYLLGFSINVLTLFALVLSIGIVVDDAIVVVEAVQEKIDSTNLSVRQATIQTIGEIAPAIISITLVMASVFLPIGFMEGPVGIFYRQFAYTLIAAILISAVNALTLSPALCALFLKRKTKTVDAADAIEEKPKTLKAKAVYQRNRFFNGFNDRFHSLTMRYIVSVFQLIKRRKLAIIGLVGVTVIGFLLMQFTPTSFIPDEDDGFLTYSLELPAGSSLTRTSETLDKAIAILSKREEIKSTSSSAGYNIADNSRSTSYAMGYISMYPHKERRGIRNVNDFADTIRKELSVINDAKVSVFMRPTIVGFGERSGLSLVLEDKLGGSFQSFGDVTNEFLAKLNNREEILQATTTFKPDYPQYEIVVDREKAKVMGVDIKDMLNNIRQYYSRVRVSEFNLFNRLNRVYIQASPEFTANPETLNAIYVRNKSGDMVPVNTLVKLVKTYGPEIVNRYNLFNSVEINAIPAKGFSTGDAMKAIEETAYNELPSNYQYEWTGMSLEEEKSGNQIAFIIILSLLFVYFLLAAQYESYLIPLSVLLSVPVGLIGVFGLVNLVGLENNVYVQIGLIMLIGLLAKNAILIVEYSLQRRKAGLSIVKSALEGARLRLRPILMTSLAFVAGIIPLMWTSGASAVGNHSVSYAAAGGMLAGIVLGIFIIPVLFVVFKGMDESLKSKFNTTTE